MSKLLVDGCVVFGEGNDFSVCADWYRLEV